MHSVSRALGKSSLIQKPLLTIAACPMTTMIQGRYPSKHNPTPRQKMNCAPKLGRDKS